MAFSYSFCTISKVLCRFGKLGVGLKPSPCQIGKWCRGGDRVQLSFSESCLCEVHNPLVEDLGFSFTGALRCRSHIVLAFLAIMFANLEQ